ncbi:hypothetical protein [Phormidesmis sp. 146-35]
MRYLFADCRNNSGLQRSLLGFWKERSLFLVERCDRGSLLRDAIVIFE